MTSLACTHEYEDALFVTENIVEMVVAGFVSGALLVQKSTLKAQVNEKKSIFRKMKHPYNVRGKMFFFYDFQ